MASWSAENATKAYLQALKMGKRGKELSEVEFLAALAAGNSSQLMVMASGGDSGATALALALVCASRQTGGRAVCIFRSPEELAASRKSLGRYEDLEFVVGDAWKLLSSDYKSADFMLIDCKLDDDDEEKAALPAAQGGGGGGAVVVGYNALRSGGARWRRGGFGAQFLPIGEGLLVGRISADTDHEEEKKKKGWIFEVDEFTGEEHFYKINSSNIRK